MRITCNICKEKVDVAMFFYNQRLISAQFLPSDPIEYKAVVEGKAICPVCGSTIRKTFSSLVDDRVIERLAVEKGGAE